jgi:hypothetical protein
MELAPLMVSRSDTAKSWSRRCSRRDIRQDTGEHFLPRQGGVTRPLVLDQGAEVGWEGTVKLMLVMAEKRRSSSALRAHAAASAPVISAQIAKLWARATRYWVAVT